MLSLLSDMSALSWRPLELGQLPLVALGSRGQVRGGVLHLRDFVVVVIIMIFIFIIVTINIIVVVIIILIIIVVTIIIIKGSTLLLLLETLF